MENFTTHLKNVGYVFQGSEIYGGLSSTWDYGDLGARTIKKIKDIWFSHFADGDLNIFAMDSSVLLSNDVWRASGHINSFEDVLVECKNCHKRFKIEHISKKTVANTKNIDAKWLIENTVECNNCKKKKWTLPKKFNLMFKVKYSKNNNDVDDIYLRPETAQGIFINFLNIVNSTSTKLPFGVAQIGKSFRNEVTTSNFIFRTKEFEQMEIEWFCEEKDAERYFLILLDKMKSFFEMVGIKEESLTVYKQTESELAHYSTKTYDILFNYAFGSLELAGLADRGTYDLEVHSKASKSQLGMKNEKNEWFFPRVIEPSFGVGRTLLSVLWDNFHIETLEDKTQRIVLKLPPSIAPYVASVLPLSKKLGSNAKEEVMKVLKFLPIYYEETGSIGKRYRRQDAKGIPFCITYDFDSVSDQAVTVRNRDTMKQERIKISDLRSYIADKMHNYDI